MHFYRSTRQLLALLLLAGFTQDLEAAPQYKFTTLASFDGVNGKNPQAGVVFDGSGNLYGTTSGSGGGANMGTVFKLDALTGVLSAISSFVGTNGSHPSADVTFAANGMIYGTTSLGGATGNGTIFELNPVTEVLNTLVSFGGPNGAWPRAELTIDSSGLMYSTTNYGGANSWPGTVFQFNPDNGLLTTLKSFNVTNGAAPSAGLVIDAQGRLYGTTETGGPTQGPFSDGLGTVFRLDPTSGVLTTLAFFNGTNGATPTASMVFDSAGNLYGTTQYGGAFPGPFNNGLGTVFRINATTGVLTTLVSFDGSNGSTPLGNLISDSDGKLYGTTGWGGEFDAGTVFCLDPTTGVLTTLHSFNGFNGGVPYGGVIADASGNLYGTTGFGGEHGHGTIFKLSPIAPGDFDGDGDVDGRDFLAWQRGASPNPGSVGDLADWQANYGTGSLAGIGDDPARGLAVPEPASCFVFLLLAGLLPMRVTRG